MNEVKKGGVGADRDGGEAGRGGVGSRVCVSVTRLPQYRSGVTLPDLMAAPLHLLVRPLDLLFLLFLSNLASSIHLKTSVLPTKTRPRGTPHLSPVWLLPYRGVEVMLGFT